jgi:hypothetical protein
MRAKLVREQVGGQDAPTRELEVPVAQGASAVK